MDSTYDSWTQCDSILHPQTYARTLASIGVNIFAGTYNQGIYLSTDNGYNWKLSNNGLLNNSVEILMTSDSNIYAGTDGGMFVSSNNGDSWNAINSGLTTSKITSITLSGKNLFVGTGGGGVFLSTNRGLEWKQVNTGLSELYIYAVYANATYLFASTSSASWRRPISEMITQRIEIDAKKPTAFVLEQNYPNPFNPTTTIAFSIPINEFVQLKIFDLLGREVATLVAEQLHEGAYQKQWNAQQNSTGIYYYRLTAGNYSLVRKLNLLR